MCCNEVVKNGLINGTTMFFRRVDYVNSSATFDVTPKSSGGVKKTRLRNSAGLGANTVMSWPYLSI